MDVDAARGLLRFFDELEDPRMDRTKFHSLGDILFITICAVLTGADTWTSVEMYGNEKLDWLRTVLALPHGIPSHDTFGRVFSRLNPEQFERCLLQWMAALTERSDGRLIAIDGKTLRRSFDKANDRAAIHMISAWCEANSLVLGQLATEEKSNEITAIPRLLEMLDVNGAVVTIDAMGCQKAIAETIVKQGGDYMLQVKKNQPELYGLVTSTFDELTGPGIGGVSPVFHEDVDAGHGRVETRRIWTTDWTSWYPGRSEWAGLQSFACVESVRVVDGESSTARRYYISTLDGQDAEGMLGYSRGHWGIENNVHWSLDVTFREDTLRNRVGHSAENFSRIRRLALNLLRKDRTCKASIQRKRYKASLNQDYLLRVLGLGV
jgi:predicted transposase YbfD/YdcC